MEKIPQTENNHYSQEIVFNGNDKDTDIFNSRMDLKLENCRQKIEGIINNNDDFENDQEYLKLKYFLHIANAVRFKYGANYEEIHLSLLKQSTQVNDEIFSETWLAVEDYVRNGWRKKEGFFNFFKKENNDNLIIERVDVSYDEEGQLIWAEISKDKSKKLIWHKTGMAAFKMDYGNSLVKHDSNILKLENFLRSKYGKNKSINLAEEIK